MTTTDERTPLDPTISEIHRLIDSISGRLDTITAALDSIGRPPVDMLAAPDDPLREFRLPSGRVAYAEEAARWVHVGDWIQAVHGDEGCWEQVVGTVRADQQTCITSTDGTRTQGRWWGHDDKVRVATAPVPDPEPWRRAWR
jgi:hypothetical protein